jgi:hypothetical protein
MANPTMSNNTVILTSDNNWGEWERQFLTKASHLGMRDFVTIGHPDFANMDDFPEQPEKPDITKYKKRHAEYPDQPTDEPAETSTDLCNSDFESFIMERLIFYVLSKDWEPVWKGYRALEAWMLDTSL